MQKMDTLKIQDTNINIRIATHKGAKQGINREEQISMYCVKTDARHT